MAKLVDGPPFNAKHSIRGRGVTVGEDESRIRVSPWPAMGNDLTMGNETPAVLYIAKQVSRKSHLIFTEKRVAVVKTAH